MLTITLRGKNGEPEVKTCDFVPVRKYRDYLELQVALSDEGLSEVEKLDKQLGFIASLFEDVTAEQLLDGLSMAELNEVSADVFVLLVGGDLDSEGK